MGIDVLEKKFLEYSKSHPENTPRLAEIAAEVGRIQTAMRALLDGITARLCGNCTASCCMCMPVEGWFTESDYFVYRMKYPAPFDLKTPQPDARGCSFLGERGCVLPADLRPFPCVKVNCRNVSSALADQHHDREFQALYNELGSLQEELWTLLRHVLSMNVVQAQSL